MPKFKKKPVVVEAVQWNGESPLPAGCVYGNSESPDPDICFLPAPSGPVSVEPGDWIVTEANRRTLCKPDIFEATYNPIEDIVLCGDGAVLVSYVDRLAGSAAILEERKAAAKGVDSEPSGFKVRCGKCGEVVMRATFAVC